jgi:hypothetical protein
VPVAAMSSSFSGPDVFGEAITWFEDVRRRVEGQVYATLDGKAATVTAFLEQPEGDLARVRRLRGREWLGAAFAALPAPTAKAARSCGIGAKPRSSAGSRSKRVAPDICLAGGRQHQCPLPGHFEIISSFKIWSRTPSFRVDDHQGRLR